MIQMMSKRSSSSSSSSQANDKKEHIKRPLNAFLVWSRIERRKIGQANPKMQSSEISRWLGSKWQMLTETQKQPFFDEAERIRAQHMIDHPSYKFRPRRKPKMTSMSFPSSRGQVEGVICSGCMVQEPPHQLYWKLHGKLPPAQDAQVQSKASCSPPQEMQAFCMCSIPGENGDPSRITLSSRVTSSSDTLSSSLGDSQQSPSYVSPCKC